MFARLLWFVALFATITTCSMALQCYQGYQRSATAVSCNTNWCLNATTLSGVIDYACDSNDACAELGSGCIDNKIVHNSGFQSICCCNSDLCNKDNCLHCICLQESNCSPIGCRMDKGTLSCGYYQIKWPYYEDCGQPGGQGENAWKQCSDDYNCATTCVQRYINKYAYKCQGVGPCEQTARLHNGGPNGCNDGGTIGYWNAIHTCCGCS